MSNQQRPFSWFRLAAFGRPVQPISAPTVPTPLPPPPAQPFRPPVIQFRPTKPQQTNQPPPPAAPTVAPAPTVQPGAAITTTAPAVTAASVPASSSSLTFPAQKQLPETSTFLRITSSSFNLRTPETNSLPPSSSFTPSPILKPAASPQPPKTPLPAATVTAPTTATSLSPAIIKPSKEPLPNYPVRKPVTPPSSRAIIEKEAPTEAENKPMLVQEIEGNSKLTPRIANKNEKDRQPMKGKPFDHKKGTEHKELPRRLVTLVGENQGAIMALRPSTNTYYGFGGRKPHSVVKKEQGHIDEQAGSKKREVSHRTMSTLFINSNVQGVNNSILDSSNLTHHDPGFHLSFSAD